MKFGIIFILAILLNSMMAFGQELKFIEVETNLVVDIDAAQSWSIVNDWENLHQLTPEVVESTIVNGEGLSSIWKINLVNGGSITEKMVYYDSSKRTMSYVMTETPMPIENYLAVIKVEPYGISKSLVSFYTSCNTVAENFKNIKNTFLVFQETYLSNIEKQKQ